MIRTILMLAIGLALTMTAWIGPARASETREALRSLCGPRAVRLARQVESAAALAKIDPVLLVAVGFVESTCNAKARNKRSGAAGFMGILPRGSANPQHLSDAELLVPETSIRLGAQHLRRCIDLCGEVEGALSVYNGRRWCRPSAYSRRVLALWEFAKRKYLEARRS